MKGSRCHPLALEDSEDRYAAIVRAATDMGHPMGLRVVCEGVETAAHAATLNEMGCDVLQGYGVARPMPVEQLLPWLAAWPTRPRR